MWEEACILSRLEPRSGAGDGVVSAAAELLSSSAASAGTCPIQGLRSSLGLSACPLLKYSKRAGPVVFQVLGSKAVEVQLAGRRNQDYQVICNRVKEHLFKIIDPRIVLVSVLHPNGTFCQQSVCFL